MDRGTDAEMEGRVDERAEERRVELIEGIMEGDFLTECLVSYCSSFSDMELSCTVDQSRIPLFDQHSEKLYKALSENVRRSSDQRPMTFQQLALEPAMDMLCKTDVSGLVSAVYLNVLVSYEGS
jgi:signal transduction histidine kinase